MDFTFEQLPSAVTQLYHKLSNIERLLLQKGNDTAPEADELLNIQQAAQLLNLKVATMYGYVHRNEIPVCKGSKRLYFSKAELTEWVKSGRRKTTAEIQAEADAYVNNGRRKGGSHV